MPPQNQKTSLNSRVAVPDRSLTEGLFNQFMKELTTRGILRRIPLRHVKVVFFNFLTAVGGGRDQRQNRDLMEKYLRHFNRSNVDNERRFTLPDATFKSTSEQLDQLIFNYLSDTFSASVEIPRPPQFTTRATPSWVTKPAKTTTEPPNAIFSLPTLEESNTWDPLIGSSTTTFGGVASNTARPTTKSMMAEMKFPSTLKDKIKYQFMHDPDKFNPTESSSLELVQATTNPPFYPQLASLKPNDSDNPFSLQPNFNNKQTSTQSPSTSTTTFRPETNVNLTMDHWSQIFNKLNLALDKLSSIDNREESNGNTADPTILDNPQYINQKGQSLVDINNDNSTDVVVNVVSYDDQDEYDPDHDIDYLDYFQAVIDTDNLSLDQIEEEKTNTDYLDLYEDMVDQLFNVDTIASQQATNLLPGVGNKNPSPLSNFPTDAKTTLGSKPDLGKYPVHLPIPLREAEKIGIRFQSIPNDGAKQPINIGTTPTQSNDRVRGKTKLTAPSIIRLLFGPPTNMSEVRVSIPDFTSSGPVNIPSSLQLYGNIGKYINESFTDEEDDDHYHRHESIPDVPSYPQHYDHESIPNVPPYSQHFDTLSSISSFNGHPVAHNYQSSVEQNFKNQAPPRTKDGGAINTAFLAALVDLLEENERKKEVRRPAMPIPLTDAPKYHLKLPTQSTLPKPQSLLALEAKGRPAQPVPIEWLQKRTIPNLQRSSGITMPTKKSELEMDSFLRRFSQSPFDSNVSRFKSPPVMLPINTADSLSLTALQRLQSSSTAKPFTILNPQSIPLPSFPATFPSSSSSRLKSFLPIRQRRSSSLANQGTFILQPPDSLKDFVNSAGEGSPDVQLHPDEAVIGIQQSRPNLTSTSTTTSTTTTSSPTTTRRSTILSKPSAIANNELVSAQTQLFLPGASSSGSSQTTLLGFPNPFLSPSSSGSFSYNKLMIAAALSIVPTLAIAMPFLAPTVGKRKKKRRKK